MSSVVAGETPLINLAEDLEDGEIDDDDDEDEEQKPQQQKIQTQQQQVKPAAFKACGSNDEVQFVGIERLSEKHDDDVIFLGMDSETAATNSNKSKKPRPLEGKQQQRKLLFVTPLLTAPLFRPIHPLPPLTDDHAVSIENAIAKALKKGGIEPPLSKLNNINNHNSDADSAANAAGDSGSAAIGLDSCQIGGQQPSSRSSRRRKRKKEREREQKKDKEHQVGRCFKLTVPTVRLSLMYPLPLES